MIRKQEKKVGNLGEAEEFYFAEFYRFKKSPKSV